MEHVTCGRLHPAVTEKPADDRQALAAGNELIITHGNGPQVGLLALQEVDPLDAAFADPAKFIGSVYDESAARRLAQERGWSIKPDRANWRRVVPSPRPQRIFETRPIRWLLEHDTVVICAGGGGIPTKYNAERQLVGVEAVIDKDFASELLARELAADRFCMATDVDTVGMTCYDPE